MADGDGETRAETVARLAYHDPDWRWVQGLCLRLFVDPDPAVRVSAVRSLADLARIHRQLDMKQVVEALELLRADPAVAPYIDEALEDIAVFLRTAG